MLWMYPYRFVNVIYVLLIFMGGVFMWWASWNILDTYIPNRTCVNIIIFLIGIIIIAVFKSLYDMNMMKQERIMNQYSYL